MGLTPEEFAARIRAEIDALGSGQHRRRTALRQALRKTEEWIPKTKKVELNHADKLFGPDCPGD
jgi:hypothetical protein